MWFNRLFKKTKKRDWYKTHPEIRIVPAFTLEATDEYPKTTYYEFEDANNLSVGRAFAAANFYKELSMSVTHDFLVAHTTAVDKILRHTKSIDVFEVAKLNAQLKERHEMIIDSLTPYKVASVIYFDESEDPYSFDYNYAFKKIERFKKQGASFFLQTPAKKLLPSLEWSQETLQNFLMIAQEIDKKHYDHILGVLSRLLSEKEKNVDWLRQLKLEKNII